MSLQLICGILVLLVSLLMAKGIFTGWLTKKYTESSVEEFCKKNLLAAILFAVGLILDGAQPSGLWGLIAMVLCAAGVALCGMFLRVLEAK